MIPPKQPAASAAHVADAANNANQKETHHAI